MPNSQSILQKGDKRRWHIIDASDREIRQRSRESYLTFEALYSDTNVLWKHTGNTSSFMWAVMVSTDNGLTWTEKAPTTEGTVLATLDAGEKLLVKRTSIYAYMANNAIYNSFSSDKDVWVYGNIQSLKAGDNFANDVTIPARYMYGKLFMGMTTLRTNPKKGVIVLPATYGTELLAVYQELFSGCTKLTDAPELPAKNLGTQIYQSAFYNCGLLRVAPKLPATILADYCYYNMFRASGIEEIFLPALTVPAQGYRLMLQSCANLKKVTCLATDISASNATNSWMGGVPATGLFIKNPLMTSWPRNAAGIPTGWTVEDYNP